ncbi:hypothetical protein BO71DRAFT_404728 [Aspergillus ellipticus CBS 707.79]|uniref:NAD(P)-binding protein n=1 Tax=Aspergillus ellipticus CBS 707.79 TaxID=1448320 RepID=A0A319CPP0_9EURO|nr:hypothetical protein BO71DRAFT_404728 [Aspergillus ellipticus CBS 707.79]
MATPVPTLHRALTTLTKQQAQALQLTHDMLRIQVLMHLFRIAVSLALLPVDNTVLLAAYAAGYLPSTSTSPRPPPRRKPLIPKTVLITGINTPHGLTLARHFYAAGHRVIGACITSTTIPPGSSKSRVLSGYYRIPRTAYIPGLIDVVQREGVDLWIPCADEDLWDSHHNTNTNTNNHNNHNHTNSNNNGSSKNGGGSSSSSNSSSSNEAKGTIESRTNCKCISFDSDICGIFNNRDRFLAWAREKGFPVVEECEVVSRDAIHKILNRSRGKVFSVGRGDEGRVVLPKRTMSLTYSEVSEMKISRERPWVLVQESRLGDGAVCGSCGWVCGWGDGREAFAGGAGGGGAGGGVFGGVGGAAYEWGGGEWVEGCRGGDGGGDVHDTTDADAGG